MWEINKEKTEDHWLELNDPDGWYKAVAKWDGCIHFNSYSNISLHEDPERKSHQCCDNYIHICDVDVFIERLQQLKLQAKKHFGDDWNE
jgi:hypothetical protein